MLGDGTGAFVDVTSSQHIDVKAAAWLNIGLELNNSGASRKNVAASWYSLQRCWMSLFSYSSFQPRREEIYSPRGLATTRTDHFRVSKPVILLQWVWINWHASRTPGAWLP
jgi:hypothetical protein